MNTKAVKMEIALFIGFLLTILFTGIVSFAQQCGEIRNDVLRFHILANSDREEDQTLKLSVRDKVLETSQQILGQAASKQDAEQLLKSNLSKLVDAAQLEVKQQGYNYPIRAELVNMYFDTREYDTFTMPAGRYDAIRIIIGSGEGHNWWCVMFPQMCIPAALGGDEDFSSFTEEQINLLQSKPQYEARFAIVELWEKWKELASKKEKDQPTEEDIDVDSVNTEKVSITNSPMPQGE